MSLQTVTITGLVLALIVSIIANHLNVRKFLAQMNTLHALLKTEQYKEVKTLEEGMERAKAHRKILENQIPKRKPPSGLRA